MQDRANSDLLLEIIKRPGLLVELTASDQTLVLRQAHKIQLMGWLACRIEQQDLTDRCSRKLQERLLAAGIYAAEHRRMIDWEVLQIQRALRGLELEPIFLKGAAYALAGLDMACGRLVSDVDILVTKEQLAAVERALIERGWEAMTLDEYDQGYYRTWMHELPPLRHTQRNTVVDIHHRILPATSRLKPPPERLIEAAVSLKERGFKVLSPADTVLHKLVHLFHDGDFANGLRELVDLDGLLRDYGQRAGFWEGLVPRAEELGLMRPLYYGLRYSRRLLMTPVPPAVQGAAVEGQPVVPIRMLMDRLLFSVLVPGHPDRTYPGKMLAGWLLYIRSHWLRMPPLLLGRHLLIKAFRSKPGDRT